jgi:ABC-type nitrate/sulfonate/bicarbonate transport system permease component
VTRRGRFMGLGLELGVPLAGAALLATWTERQESYYYPPLADVMASFADTWLFEHVATDLAPSLARMAAGLAIAVTMGIPAGLLLGRKPQLRRATTPIIEFSRAIPPPALLPAAIVAIGVGNSMKILLIAFVCVWPVLLDTIDGAAGLDPTFEETARAYGIRRHDLWLRVVLPAAAPQTLAGVRIAVSLALIVMVISEMVASTNGIGHFILYSQRTFAITEMWSGILLLGILGCGLNALLGSIEHRLLRWPRAAHPVEGTAS